MRDSPDHSDFFLGWWCDVIKEHTGALFSELLRATAHYLEESVDVFLRARAVGKQSVEDIRVYLVVDLLF